MPGLRVAVDVTPLLGVQAGVALCVRELLASLAEAAPDVEVVPYVLSRRARRQRHALPPATRALPLPASAAIRVWGVIDRPAADRWLGEVDVVHGTNFVVPPTRRPSTVTVHDCWCLAHPESCEPAVRPFGRALRRAVRRGALVHVSTTAVEREVRELFPGAPTAVVPFGTPPVGPPGPLPNDVRPPYVLALSTLDPRKRHVHLVQAFGLVADRAADAQLVIAGADGAATAAVTAAVDALPPAARSRVVRLGPVDRETRSALLRSATALAYPSADEGFGFPVLEAMAVDVPVVTSDVGGIPEVAGDAALLVPVGDDPSVLADAIARVLDDDSLRYRLRGRGRHRVASFTWEAHAAGMAALWRALAHES